MKSKKLFDSIKIVTFDITGTLLKFRKRPIQIYTEVASEHGVTVLDSTTLSQSFNKQWKRLNSEQPHFGHCWKKWWYQFVILTFKNTHCTGATPEKLNSVAEDLIRRFATNEYWEVRPFVKELLEYLKYTRHLHVGVISNFDTRLHNILSAMELTPLLDFVLTSHECQISKPDPKIFTLGFDRGKMFHPNLNCQEILHVGDNYDLDCVGATSIGWNACLVQEKQSCQNQDTESAHIVTSNGKLCHVFPNLGSLCEQF